VVGREQKRQKTTADEHEILEDRHETPRHPLPIEAGVTTGKSGKRSSTSSHYTALCDCSPATAGDKTAIAIAWRFGMSIEIADAAASLRSHPLSSADILSLAVRNQHRQIYRRVVAPPRQQRATQKRRLNRSGAAMAATQHGRKVSSLPGTNCRFFPFASRPEDLPRAFGVTSWKRRLLDYWERWPLSAR
jgi:hypothetical protein